MTLRFKVKIKGKNVPEFKKGLGEGVLAEQKVNIPDTYDDLIVGAFIAERKRELVNQYVEVTCEEDEENRT